jgi:hypothetical protein
VGVVLVADDEGLSVDRCSIGPLDWTTLLADQVDVHRRGQQLPRLEGLTDDED